MRREMMSMAEIAEALGCTQALVSVALRGVKPARILPGRGKKQLYDVRDVKGVLEKHFAKLRASAEAKGMIWLERIERARELGRARDEKEG